MKTILLLSAIFSFNTFAQASVQTYNLFDKYLVVIKGQHDRQLSRFINAFGATPFEKESKNKDVVFFCNEMSGFSSCSIKFVKSNDVEIADGNLSADVGASDLGNLVPISEINETFHSSNGKVFEIQLNEDGLYSTID